MLGYFIINPEQLFGWCPGEVTVGGVRNLCYVPFFENYGYLIYLGGLYLLPTTLLLFGMTSQSFKAWKKLTLWFIPFSIIFLIFSVQEDGGVWIFGDLLPENKIAQTLGIFFLFLTLLILILGRIPKKK